MRGREWGRVKMGGKGGGGEERLREGGKGKVRISGRGRITHVYTCMWISV